jgi:hypothetical protein
MLTLIWGGGDNTDTIHKTREAPINTSKEASPEVNPDVSSPHMTNLQQRQVKDPLKRPQNYNILE